MDESKIVRLPRRHAKRVTLYTWDRQSDGASDYLLYKTLRACRKAAAGCYGKSRLFRVTFEKRYTKDDPNYKQLTQDQRQQYMIIDETLIQTM